VRERLVPSRLRRVHMWDIKNQSWTAGFAVLLAFSGLAACTHTPPSRLEPSQPQAERSASPIGIDATEDLIKQAVAGVRAGRRLTPRVWPNGARVAAFANCAAREADRLHEIQPRRLVCNARADCNLREEIQRKSLTFCRHRCRGVWQGQRCRCRVGGPSRSRSTIQERPRGNEVPVA